MTKKIDIYCEKYGFVADNTKEQFKRILGSKNFKELYIDIYTDEPYMLLLRAEEKNVVTIMEDDRIIIRKRDKIRTTILNILEKSVDNCIVKEYNNNCSQVIMTIHNITYKLTLIV